MPRGHLDQATRRCIRGWAIDDSSLSVAARVEIRIDGDLVACLTANQSRGDLEAAFGTARHGFELFLPGLSSLRRHLVSARIAGSAEDLPNSPLIIEAADAFDAEVEASLSRLIEASDLPTLDRAAVALSSLIDTILDRRAALLSHQDARDLKYRWFAHRGSEPMLQPPQVSRRALIVVPAGPEGQEAFDGFLVARHAAALRRLGFDVSFASEDLVPLAGPERDGLSRQGIDLPCRPFWASIEELLRRHRDAWTVVLLAGEGLVLRYAALVAHLCPRAGLLHVATARDPARYDGLRSHGVEGRCVLASSSCTTLRHAPTSRALDVCNVVVSWAARLAPSTTPVQRRRGVAILDDPQSMPRLLLDLLRDAMEIVHRDAPELPVFWRGISGPDFDAVQLVSFDRAMSIAEIAERTRVAVTLAVTPLAYGDAVDCFAAGLPCIAPRQLLRDLGLPDDLASCETGKARDLAAAVLRLHEEAAHAAEVRKRALDAFDLDHAPDVVDAALKRAIRIARTPRTMPVEWSPACAPDVEMTAC